ncbi:MAG: tetratricopeptide repeat protein [Chitinophagaceae bacterium]|nr:MAG: tetratricopeptide repeat protein [Chitinophagaceae bacterium]
MTKNTKQTNQEEVVDYGAETLGQVKSFWDKNGKVITYALIGFVVAIGGYFGYKNFIAEPKQREAAEKSFAAQDYFAVDSFALALNGDASHPGFIKIADQFSGTEAGNLAKFYAGVCYIQLNQNDKAVQYLKDFSTDSKGVQQRAYKLLGDAYGDLGNAKEALNYYKKAANYFPKDITASAEALFSAAYLAQHVVKDNKEAVELYKQLKSKYGNTQQGAEADKYLAQLGVLNAD